MKNVVSLNRRPDAGTIFLQLITILAIILGSALISAFLGIAITTVATGVKAPDLAGLGDSSPAIVVTAYKILQFILMCGLFLVPALIIPWLVFKVSPVRYLSLNRISSIAIFLMALVAYFALMPAMEWTIQINQKLQLPHSLQSVQETIEHMEEEAATATRRFLEMPSIGVFIFNVILIALLPAVAEELFFRGMVQRTLYGWTRKIHLSIILTAIIFSFVHFQFFGFLPRMLLGMLLGYLLYWTGDIKVSMFVHFLNNFTAVLASYIGQIKHQEIDPDKMSISPWLVLFSLLLGGIILVGIYKTGLKRKEQRRAKDEEAEGLIRGDISWEKIYTTDKHYEAEIVTGFLKNENIDAVIVNKKDSSYTNFGYLEIYVPQEQAEKAKQILSSHSNE